LDIETTDGVDHTEPRSDRPLGLVLMGSRIAEINEHAVAHVLRDKAVEAIDDVADGAVISGVDFAQFLRIEPQRALSSRRDRKTSR
jgi:hypothetical protein